MEISVTFTIPSPAAVPEGTWFEIPNGNVVIPDPMDVWVGEKLFTCSWEQEEDNKNKYVMVMSPSEAG